MDSYSVKNTKQFMAKLLIEGALDNFYFESGKITTFNTFSIDGLIKKEFYSEEEAAEITDKYSEFRKVRPLIYEMIKGKNTPLMFAFVLYAPKDMYENADYEAGVRYVLNIRFEAGVIKCISGISYPGFSLDKSSDALWDKKIMAFIETLD